MEVKHRHLVGVVAHSALGGSHMIEVTTIENVLSLLCYAGFRRGNTAR